VVKVAKAVKVVKVQK